MTDIKELSDEQIDLIAISHDAQSQALHDLHDMRVFARAAIARGRALILGDTDFVSPIKPLELVQVTLSDEASVALIPEHAYFCARDMQDLESAALASYGAGQEAASNLRRFARAVVARDRSLHPPQVLASADSVWPRKPLGKVQVTLGDGISAVATPERAYFDLMAVQSMLQEIQDMGKILRAAPSPLDHERPLA